MKNVALIACGVLLLVNLFGCETAVVSATKADTGDTVGYTSMIGIASASVTLPELLSPDSSSVSCAIDQDYDGVPAELDCDDHNPDIYPGAYELCDYEDNDCNGQVDENWSALFGDVLGKPCSAVGENLCVSEGIWECDFWKDWVVCNAPPIQQPALTEKCNDLDDDCNGITDTDKWPELGSECTVVGQYCLMHGVWVCDSYTQNIHCTAEDVIDPPDDCSPLGS